MMPTLSLSDDIKERGLVYQSNDWNGAMTETLSGLQCAYVGFDCTAPSLHVGHLMPIMLLRLWQKAGHRPIVVFGSATTLVGDPTGKEASRPMLTAQKIEANKFTLANVFKKFLDIDDPKTGAIFVDNLTWWKDISYLDLLGTVGPLLTVNSMVHFETVARRLQAHQPLSFLEFNYMVLQGYDFVHLLRSLGCKFQFGGSDQWANMLVGSDLIHKMQLGSSYVITTPLLTTASGKKMGKTEQGAVWLDPDFLSDFDYWQFWRNCDDQDCEKLLLAMTDLDPGFIKSYFKNLEPGQINQAKVLLANEQTKICRGEKAQEIAYMRAQAIFTGNNDESRKEALPRCALSGESEELLVDFMIRHNMAESKSAAKKLIDQKAVKINNSLVNEVFYRLILEDYIHKSAVLSIGKKKHYLIICS